MPKSAKMTGAGWLHGWLLSAGRIGGGRSSHQVPGPQPAGAAVVAADRDRRAYVEPGGSVRCYCKGPLHPDQGSKACSPVWWVISGIPISSASSRARA